jgi:hypothetical protein
MGYSIKTIYPNLQKKMIEQGVSPSDLAELCEITKLSCTLKLLGFTPWKYTEVVQICTLLGTSEAERLFLRLHIIS